MNEIPTMTRDTIERYFRNLRDKNAWEPFLADDMTFTSFTSPLKRVSGKTAYLEATKRFYSTIASVELKELLVNGDRGCALTHYELQPPSGCPFSCDVAEVFGVRGGKITSFEIYFDTAPFPK